MKIRHWAHRLAKARDLWVGAPSPPLRPIALRVFNSGCGNQQRSDY
jgi:hypothetical protein